MHGLQQVMVGLHIVRRQMLSQGSRGMAVTLKNTDGLLEVEINAQPARTYREHR